MITEEQNERFTHVGPGTPAGELLRRYWQPLACAADLVDKPTKRVRLLGEDLALFRDAAGELGLVAENCPHRRCSLAYGVPENEGIRCPYHGWLFDNKGNCLEQPAESSASSFKDRIKTIAYPVREMGGLIWAYMGPGEPPILPEYDFFVQPNTLRSIGKVFLPCNWFQTMENVLDPTHVEWLHQWYAYYLTHGTGHTPDGGWPQSRHTKIGFDLTEWGIVKRRLRGNATEDDRTWTVGHPMLFPQIEKVGVEAQIRIIIDDTHTLHLMYSANRFDDVEVPHQDVIPAYDFPYRYPDGSFDVTITMQQDLMAWVTQGEISDRTVEHLGGSDRGILMFRQLFEEQMQRVEAGEDPIFVYRDDAHRGQINIEIEGGLEDAPGFKQLLEGKTLTAGDLDRIRRNTNLNPYNPIRDEVERLRLETIKKWRSIA